MQVWGKDKVMEVEEKGKNSSQVSQQKQELNAFKYFSLEGNKYIQYTSICQALD